MRCIEPIEPYCLSPNIYFKSRSETVCCVGETIKDQRVHLVTGQRLHCKGTYRLQAKVKTLQGKSESESARAMAAHVAYLLGYDAARLSAYGNCPYFPLQVQLPTSGSNFRRARMPRAARPTSRARGLPLRQFSIANGHCHAFASFDVPFEANFFIGNNSRLPKQE